MVATPDGDAITPESLRELFGAVSPYATSTLVPLVADRIGLPTNPGSVPLTRHMSRRDRALYETPDRLLRPPDTAAAGVDQSRGGQPAAGRRPLVGRVGGEHSEYVKLVKRCMTAGLWGLHDSQADGGPPPVVNGVFAVRKDTQNDRLIVDARPANRCFVEPRAVALPTPDVVGELEVIRRVVGARDGLFVAKTDLSDYYHQLSLPPWLTRYFCLPPVRRSELDGGDDHSLVHPKCLVLPMGWSHSVIAAQIVHEHIVKAAGLYDDAPALSRLSDGVVRDGQPRLQVYIDDVVVYGTDQPSVQRLQDRYVEAIRRSGLTVKATKTIAARSWPPVKCVGVEVDGRALTAGVGPSDVMATIRETRLILRAGIANAFQMASLVGSWNWALSVSRQAMSVFHAVYGFTRALVRFDPLRRRPLPLWPSVRRELSAACDLAPLLSVSIASATSPLCVATDASSEGYGVASTVLDSSDAARRVAADVSSAHTLRLMAQARPTAPAGEGRDTAMAVLQAKAEGRNLFGGDVLPCVAAAEAGVAAAGAAGLAVGFRVMTQTDDSPLIGLKRGVERLIGDAAERHWSVGVSGRWAMGPADSAGAGATAGRGEHINALELRTAGYGIAHALRAGVPFDSRFVLLTDSTVALNVLTKGRSSSPRLLRVMRRISALLLATGVRPHYRYVESEANPADLPSRCVIPYGTHFGWVPHGHCDGGGYDSGRSGDDARGTDRRAGGAWEVVAPAQGRCRDCTAIGEPVRRRNGGRH